MTEIFLLMHFPKMYSSSNGISITKFPLRMLIKTIDIDIGIGIGIGIDHTFTIYGMTPGCNVTGEIYSKVVTMEEVRI